MSEKEIKEAEHIGIELIQLFVDFKKLNKKQLEYLELRFKIEFEKDKLEKLIESKTNQT